jgi:hypothetical protein
MSVEKSTDMGQKMYDFASSLVGNRVLDIYLKYQGILTLTSTTLVPIALILGKNAMQDYLKAVRKGVDQTGGGVHLPVLDAPGIGTYLKLAGLSTLPINAATLVPLGVLMAVYQMYEERQQGGGSQRDRNMFHDFAKGLVGNRILDLFLKYKGIMTLNAYTLVPIALILGKDALTDYVKTQGNELQQGGRRVRLPIADDPLIGNYLKLAGLATLPVTTSTLVPLGVLMVVYQLYKDKIQLGGRVRRKYGSTYNRGSPQGGGGRHSQKYLNICQNCNNILSKSRRNGEHYCRNCY